MKNRDELLYQIIGEVESDGDLMPIRVLALGTGETFIKEVDELYKSEWLNKMNGEDAAFIAVCFYAKKEKKLELLKMFPRKKQRITTNVILLSALFVTFLIISNVTGFKLSSIFMNLTMLGGLNNVEVAFPVALIYFPLTYFFDDVLTEVYGYEVSRLIIWGGVLCLSLFMACAWLSVKLPPASFWGEQETYALFLNYTFQVFVASVIGYLVGEFFNAIILAKLKVLTQGKHLWARVIGSSAIGLGIDSILFCNIAFWGELNRAQITNLILVQFAFKLSYEIMALPFTYRIVKYLKRKDNVDYYDYSTNFNPFSFKIKGE